MSLNLMFTSRHLPTEANLKSVALMAKCMGKVCQTLMDLPICIFYVATFVSILNDYPNLENL